MGDPQQVMAAAMAVTLAPPLAFFQFRSTPGSNPVERHTRPEGQSPGMAGTKRCADGSGHPARADLHLKAGVPQDFSRCVTGIGLPVPGLGMGPNPLGKLVQGGAVLVDCLHGGIS